MDTEEKFKRRMKSDDETYWKLLKDHFNNESGKGYTVQNIELNTFIGKTQIASVTEAISKIDAIIDKYGE